MANSDIIKIGFDYRASLAQFEKETNGVFDGISNKAGKQKITIQLDAKDDKVIDKIKELQKLKLDKFTFEFGNSGLKEQLQTFDKLENKINEIISLSKGIDLSFNTKNKTEAYNQLKKYADAFKEYYGNEEAMATNAGAKAGYAYYKAYEEALRKGVAQSKLEKVTIDFDVNDSFFSKERIVGDRIKEFENFQKYGNADESNLIAEITSLENRLLKFNSAYSQVKANLGDAPITPEITKNIEEYVRLLEIAESRAKDAELLGYSSEDINSDKDLANMYLDFAKEDATVENKKYIESLKQEETQAIATAEAEQKLAEAQKETVSNTSNSNNFQIEELKSDIQEVKTELGDVKDRISSIESNGFENVRDDVEKTKESVKELNSELAEMKSNLSSTPQESNISLANETPKSIENTTNAITEQTNALKELILSWVEAQKVMSKSGSASTEKIAVGNLSNGFVSNSNFTGDLNSISDKLIRNIIENATETVDTIIHSHPDYNLAAFSPEDIASSIIRFATGIQNQIIVGMDEISIMDVSKIKDFNPLEIKNKIEQELSSLINSYIKNQLQSIDNLQTIFVNNFSGGLDEWSTFTDLISENTNSDFLKNVIQKYKDSISDALINMGSDYKFSNSDELGTFIYENIIKKYVRSYVSNSNPDINQSEYDALQKEALENFKKEFSAIYDKAFSIKDYESLLTDNEIQPIVKEAFSNILKTFGLKYEDVIKTISVEQLKTSYISPMKDAFPDKDVSASVESATNSIKEENNVLEQNTQKIKENTQAKEQNANINLNKYDKRLDSYNGKVDKYQATIDRFNDGGWTSSTYLENVQAVRDAVKQYETLLNELKGKDASLVTSDDISKLDEYEKKIKDTIATVTNMSAAEKGYNFVSGQKELDKIHKLLNENSKMSSEAKAKIKAYYAEIESGNPSMSLDKIHGEILKIYNAEVEAGRAGRTLWDTLKNSGFHQIAAHLAGMFGVYDIINLGKEGFNVVRELNTALTEMRKVSDESIQTLKDYQKESFNTADAIATTGLQMQNSIADWQRLGYSIKEANELAKNSNIYKNVGDMDISTATEHMVSSVQAWKSEFNDDAVKTSEEVMNRYNKIGNEFAISSADIGEAMETSAAALKAGGNDLNEALGIITAGNIIQQDASTTSSAMKILSLRIRGAKADLESMGESTDDLADSTSKLREEIKGLTGVDIMADEDTFKSTAEIIKEIGAVWNQLSDVSQAATLEKLAGKNRASTVAGLIENYETIDKVIEAASNADNSALDENQKIIESIDGRIQQLSNRVQEFWYNLVDDSVVKSAVSALTTIVEDGTKLIDTFGTLPTLLTAIGAGLSFKNVGRDKMYSPTCFEYADNIHNLLWIHRFRVC